MSDGQWEEIEISYRDNEGHYCACCGKHVARRLYVVDIDDAQRRFCSTDCADLYQWYWLPRYGVDQVGAHGSAMTSCSGQSNVNGDAPCK